LLGQLLAMPELALKLNQPAPAPMPANASGAPSIASFYAPSPALFGQSGSARLPGPNEAGFDMWCLTDESARERFRQDREAVRAIKLLWQLDPAPLRTLE